MGSYLKGGRVETRRLKLFGVAVGPDNLLSLVFPEWRHSCVTVVAVIALPSCVAQFGSEVGATSPCHCPRDSFLPVRD